MIFFPQVSNFSIYLGVAISTDPNTFWPSEKGLDPNHSPVILPQKLRLDPHIRLYFFAVFWTVSFALVGIHFASLCWNSSWDQLQYIYIHTRTHTQDHPKQTEKVGHLEVMVDTSSNYGAKHTFPHLFGGPPQYTLW